MSLYQIVNSDTMKVLFSNAYNYIFNKKTGVFLRWGASKEEDPTMCAFGPEIADIEVSTICNRGCKFCYKANTGIGSNMSLETYKAVLSKFPTMLTQVALGIGDLHSNPDIWNILDYTRSQNIIPNITINGKDLDLIYAKRLAEVCGAVSVSRYNPVDDCYNAIKMLTDAGLQQANIHAILSADTYSDNYQLLQDVQTDPRLEKINALVFLALKPKGRSSKLQYEQDLNKFFDLIQAYNDAGLNVGLDSCSAPQMLKFADKFDKKEFINSIEPCESGLFSIYVNVHGDLYPCSFAEGTKGWGVGINLLETKDFMKEVWFSERLQKWRKRLLKSSSSCKDCMVQKHCRSCPLYDITPCK